MNQPCVKLCSVALLWLVALGYALRYPIWDWDVLAYLFLAKGLLGAGVGEAHAYAYAALQGVPEVTRQALVGGDDFRRTLAVTPEALRQVSVFYQDRVGYYGVLAVLMAMKVHPLVAVQAVNMVGQAMVAGAYVAWTRVRTWGQVGGMAVLLAFPTVMKLARWSNPDGLVLGLFLVGMLIVGWGMMENRPMKTVWLGFIALGVMVVMRPNTVCWLVPLAAGVAWAGRWREAIGFLGLSGVGAGLHALWPGYGLPVLWRHTFEGAVVYPSLLKNNFESSYYVNILTYRLSDLHGRDLMLTLVMLVALVVVMGRGERGTRGLALGCVAGVGMQFLLFPALWERLIAGPVLVVVALAASAWYAPRKSPLP